MFQRIARRTLLCALLLSALSVNSNPFAAANKDISPSDDQNRVAEGKSYKSPENEVLGEHRGRRIRNRFSPASLAAVNRQLSSRLNSSINDTFAPCDDFMNYTCGSLKNSPLEDFALTDKWFDFPPYSISLRNYLESADIESPDKYENAIHKKVKKYYDACRDPLPSKSALRKARKGFRLAPIFALYDKENFRKFFSIAMAHLTLMQEYTFFELTDNSDAPDEDFAYSIFPGFLITYAEDKSLNDTVYDLAEKFANTTFLGAENLSSDAQHEWATTLKNVVMDFVNTFKAVNDTSDVYEFKSIDELQSNITWFDWKVYFSKLSMLSGNTQMVKSRVFKVTNPKYFENLGELLATASAQEAIRDVLIWRMIANNEQYLWRPEDAEKTAKYCQKRAFEVFDMVHLHLFAQKLPSDEVKAEYQDVLRIIKDSVEENLMTLGFRVPSFLKRFRDMKLEMELPDIVKSSKMLYEFYEKLHVWADDFYTNEQNANKFRLAMLLGGRTSDQLVNKAILYQLQAGLHFHPDTNTIYASPIPEIRSHHQLGVPSLVRFATRGYLIAFDVLRLLGNPEFLLKSRSGDRDKAAFEKLDSYQSCIVGHFNGTNVASAPPGDQMALNLALSIAPKLWQRFDDEEHLDIPYSRAQQFYLTFARQYCTTVQDEEGQNSVSEIIVRILQNSKGFHEAFKCPRRNEDVCQLW